MHPTPPTPSSGSDDTRQRILDAALRLFTQQGYARTPTRAIAAEARVNEVTLFRHFGSKKNLLLGCVETFNAAGFSRTFEQHLTGDYATDIAIMARLQAQDAAAGYEPVRLLLCEAHEIPEILAALQQGAQDNMARLTAYFARQQAAGIVRADLDAATLARAFDNLFSTSILMDALLNQTATSSQADVSADHLADLAALFVSGTQAP